MLQEEVASTVCCSSCAIRQAGHTICYCLELLRCQGTKDDDGQISCDCVCIQCAISQWDHNSSAFILLNDPESDKSPDSQANDEVSAHCVSRHCAAAVLCLTSNSLQLTQLGLLAIIVCNTVPLMRSDQVLCIALGHNVDCNPNHHICVSQQVNRDYLTSLKRKRFRLRLTFSAYDVKSTAGAVRGRCP